MSVESVVASTREKLRARVKARTNQLRDITRNMHRNAPRGGSNKNVWDEFRSAAGEQPAMEYGVLFALIDQSGQMDGMTGTVVVNYVVLEYGTQKAGRRVVLPRPMGRMSLAELYRQVRQ